MSEARTLSAARAVTIREDDADTQAVAAISALDLANCRLTYFVLALNEFEKAEGLRFEQWPVAIQTELNKQVGRFFAEHPKASVKAITQGVARGACVLALHWRDK